MRIESLILWSRAKRGVPAFWGCWRMTRVPCLAGDTWLGWGPNSAAQSGGVEAGSRPTDGPELSRPVVAGQAPPGGAASNLTRTRSGASKELVDRVDLS